MTAATLTAPSESLDRVRRWRLEQLERAGYPSSDALLLSGRPDVDIHQAARLLRSGCPVATAVRILA
jgi:hypothetical protein